jgi:hypothetical protein
MESLTAGDHLLIVAGIILGAGLLGGLAGYLMREPDDSGRKKGVWRWLLLGVVASALMPLALSILSSTVVADSVKDPYKYFIFGGLCLIVAVFANKFIALFGENVLKRLLRAERNAEETNRRVDVLIDSQIADEEIQPMKKVRKGSAPPNVDELIMEILAGAPTGKFYSAAALGNATAHPEYHIADELNKLRERGAVTVLTRSDGTEYWAVNPRNRKQARN